MARWRTSSSPLLRTAREVDPEIDWNGAMEDEYDRIRAFLDTDALVKPFAAYVFHVLKTFGETDMYYIE